jgi:hypothetical protein
VKFFDCADSVCTNLKLTYNKAKEVKYNLRDLPPGHEKMVKGVILSFD